MSQAIVAFYSVETENFAALALYSRRWFPKPLGVCEVGDAYTTGSSRCEERLVKGGRHRSNVERKG